MAYLLFAVELTGFRFAKEALGKIKKHEQLELLDLEDMGDRVKDMDIISAAQGTFYFYKSLQESGKSSEVDFLNLVRKTRN